MRDEFLNLHIPSKYVSCIVNISSLQRWVVKIVLKLWIQILFGCQEDGANSKLFLYGVQ